MNIENYTRPIKNRYRGWQCQQLNVTVTTYQTLILLSMINYSGINYYRFPGHKQIIKLTTIKNCAILGIHSHHLKSLEGAPREVGENFSGKDNSFKTSPNIDATINGQLIWK